MSSLLPNFPQRGAIDFEGGEATIYQVTGRPDLLLKVFRNELSERKRRLIDCLISQQSDELRQSASCPLHILEDGRSVVLARVRDGRPIHQLYDTTDRRRHFPFTHWGSIVKVARSVSEACASVHAAGFAIADMNESNILVQPSLKATLVDCDSFVPQDGGLDGVVELFTPLWLAPELVGATAITPRGPDHDNFALARVIFLLLFNGLDPLHSLSGSATSSEKEYVFGVRNGRVHWPGALTIDDVPSEIAGMFEAAFLAPSLNRKPRPTAFAWAKALERMGRRLQECSNSANHQHLSGRECPWCKLASVNPALDPFSTDGTELIDAPREIDEYISAFEIKPPALPLAGDSQIERQRLVTAISATEDDLSRLASDVPGIGHNHPPPDESLSAEHALPILREELRNLKAEVSKEVPDVVLIARTASKFAIVTRWIASKANKAGDKFIETLGASAAVGILALFASAHTEVATQLNGIVQAVLRWFHSIIL